jgi:hypothetical protein
MEAVQIISMLQLDYQKAEINGTYKTKGRNDTGLNHIRSWEEGGLTKTIQTEELTKSYCAYSFELSMAMV